MGSTVNLYNRLKNYFSIKYLERYKSMYIYNALICHTHSAFSLVILEIIDISSLSV